MLEAKNQLKNRKRNFIDHELEVMITASSEPQTLEELKVLWFQVRGQRCISAHNELMWAPGERRGDACALIIMGQNISLVPENSL